MDMLTEIVVEDRVEDLRARIDQIDTEIQLLLIKRRQVSHSIRRAKLFSGMPDTDLAREKEVLGKYRTTLGDYHGSVVGHSILAFSKDSE